MKILTTRAEVAQYVADEQKSGHRLGFVPTMGALHQGHLSLIEFAKQQSDKVICSIFVNPTQFNDPADLERYPRPIESDIKKLEEVGCDMLFMPQVTEMYAENEQWHLDLDGLDQILEGEQRPGHYQGVTQIVNKLLETVKPDRAFFGQKDYQQFLVISKLVQKLNLPVQLVMCPTVREADGLAMSSRNIHLSAEERKNALALSKTLFWIKVNFGSMPIAELQREARLQLLQSPGIELEYLVVAEGKSLQPASSASQTGLVALLAARLGKTRLIDNILLN